MLVFPCSLDGGNVLGSFVIETLSSGSSFMEVGALRRLELLGSSVELYSLLPNYQKPKCLLVKLRLNTTCTQVYK